MIPDEFKQCAKAFALKVIRLADRIPSTRTGNVVGRQLLRAGTSAAANDRATCSAKSRADLIAEMGIVQEDSDKMGLTS